MDGVSSDFGPDPLPGYSGFVAEIFFSSSRPPAILLLSFPVSNIPLLLHSHWIAQFKSLSNSCTLIREFKGFTGDEVCICVCFFHRRSNEGNVCNVCVCFVFAHAHVSKKKKKPCTGQNEKSNEIRRLKALMVGGKVSISHSLLIFTWTLKTSLSHANAALFKERSTAPWWIKMQFKRPLFYTCTANSDGHTGAGRGEKKKMEMACGVKMTENKRGLKLLACCNVR